MRTTAWLLGAGSIALWAVSIAAYIRNSNLRNDPSEPRAFAVDVTWPVLCTALWASALVFARLLRR